MTDNPALSPQRQPDDPDAALRPRLWIMLIALMTAALAGAIVEIIVFTVGALAWGEQPEAVSLKDVWLTYQAFGFVFIPLGGLLVLIFRQRTSFNLVTSAIAGMTMGALVGYLAVLIVELPGENYPGVPATIALGAVSGLAGGLTFWLICRLSMSSTDD